MSISQQEKYLRNSFAEQCFFYPPVAYWNFETPEIKSEKNTVFDFAQFNSSQVSIIKFSLIVS